MPSSGEQVVILRGVAAFAVGVGLAGAFTLGYHMPYVLAGWTGAGTVMPWSIGGLAVMAAVLVLSMVWREEKPRRAER